MYSLIATTMLTVAPKPEIQKIKGSQRLGSSKARSKQLSSQRVGGFDANQRTVAVTPGLQISKLEIS